MLLIQLQSSKSSRLQVIMNVNSNLSVLPNFGPQHPMYERYVKNLKKMDSLMNEIDDIDDTVKDAYEGSVETTKRLKLDKDYDIDVYNTPQFAALKNDDDNDSVEVTTCDSVEVTTCEIEISE
jgi:hypothetical protein